MGSYELIDFVAESINTRNLEALDPYFSKRAKIYEQGSIDDSWAEYRDGHLGREIEEFESFDIKFEIAEAFEKEELAFVRGLYELSAEIDGNPISSQGLLIFTFAMEKGNWKIIHLQFSRSCRS